MIVNSRFCGIFFETYGKDTVHISFSEKKCIHVDEPFHDMSYVLFALMQKRTKKNKAYCRQL